MASRSHQIVLLSVLLAWSCALVIYYAAAHTPKRGAEGRVMSAGPQARDSGIPAYAPTVPPTLHPGPKPVWGLVWGGQTRKGLERDFVKHFLLQDADVHECGTDIRLSTGKGCAFFAYLSWDAWRPN